MFDQLRDDTMKTFKRQRLASHEAAFQPVSVAMWYNPMVGGNLSTARLVVQRNAGADTLELLHDAPLKTVKDKIELKTLLKGAPEMTGELLLNTRAKRKYPGLLQQLQNMDMKTVREGFERRILTALTEAGITRDADGGYIDTHLKHIPVDGFIDETGEQVTLEHDQWLKQAIKKLGKTKQKQIMEDALQFDGGLNEKTAIAYVHLMSTDLFEGDKSLLFTEAGKEQIIRGFDNVDEHALVGGPDGIMNPTIIYNRNKISNNSVERVINGALNAELDAVNHPAKRYSKIDRSNLKSAFLNDDATDGNKATVMSYELRPDVVYTLNEARYKYIPPDRNTGAPDQTKNPLGEVLLTDALKYDPCQDYDTVKGLRLTPNEWLGTWKIAKDQIERGLRDKGLKGEKLEEQTARHLCALGEKMQSEIILGGEHRAIDFLAIARTAGIRTTDAGYGVSLDDVFGFKVGTFDRIQDTLNEHAKDPYKPRKSIEHVGAIIAPEQRYSGMAMAAE